MSTRFLLASGFVLSDLLWQNLVSKLFYKKKIEQIQKQPLVVRKLPAFVAYVVLIMTMFTICKPVSLFYESYFKPKTFLKRCVLSGLSYALVGFSIYGIFNCTNMAIFTNYDWLMAIVDIIWGVCSFGIFGILALIFRT